MPYIYGNPSIRTSRKIIFLNSLMNVLYFPEPEVNTEEEGDYKKPALNYTHLVTLALINNPNKEMLVVDIYHFILQNFPWFRKHLPSGKKESDWKKCIRHTLINKKQFKSVNIQVPPKRGCRRHKKLWSMLPSHGWFTFIFLIFVIFL